MGNNERTKQESLMRAFLWILGIALIFSGILPFSSELEQVYMWQYLLAGIRAIFGICLIVVLRTFK